MPEHTESCDCCHTTHNGPYTPITVFEEDHFERSAGEKTVVLCIDCAAFDGVLYPDHLNRLAAEFTTWLVLSPVAA